MPTIIPTANRLPGARLARAFALAAAAACAGALAADEPLPLDDAPGTAGPAASTPSEPDAPELRATGNDGTGSDGAVLAVLDAEALFGRGGAALPAEARAVVDRLANRLAALERVLSVRVIGHADNVGEAADNLELSERRAESIAAAFRERWPGVHTLAIGAGESEPVADNATEAGRARNRRVEIQVIGIGRPETFAEAGAEGVPSADDPSPGAPADAD